MASTVTKQEINASISGLIERLGTELKRVTDLGTPPAQRDPIRDQVRDLTLLLSQASADVAASVGNPTPLWDSWVHDAIVPGLERLGAMVSPILGADAPLGICTYDGGQFCSTQAECNLPHSHWSPGGCP
jgi:hypothetical protein